MATVDFYIDMRRAKKGTGEYPVYPVKLRVTHDRVTKYYGTGYDLSTNQVKLKSGEKDNRSERDKKPRQFEVILSGRPKKEAEIEIGIKLQALKKKAYDIIQDLEYFDFRDLENKLTSKGNRHDVIFRIKSMAEGQKKASATILNRTAWLLQTFAGKEEISFQQITPKFLNDFCIWAKNTGYQRSKKGDKGKFRAFSDTSLNIYLSRLKTVFNEAIANKEISPGCYPFGKDKVKFQVPVSENNKRALDLKEIMALYNYETDNPTEQFAKDMFLFSYLSSGMNMADIYNLKWSNFHNNSFTFLRSKTAARVKTKTPITIYLNPDLETILTRHSSKKADKEYVFDVYKPGMTEDEKYSARQSATSVTNVYLKKIAKKVGIACNLSTYFARHTYATVLMANNKPLAYISKQLGHKDLKTTQEYLSSFPDHQSKEIESVLLQKS